MKKVALLSVLASLALMLASSACGGDDALTLEEYFAKMDTFDKEIDAEFEDSGVFTEDSTAQETTDAFLGVVRPYRDKAADLKAPDEVETAHDELISAIDGAIEAMEGAEFEDDAASDALFENEEVAESFTAVDESFCAIQKIADDNNIEADVGCEAGEEGEDPSTLPAEEATEVLIEDFAFDPPHIEVSAGDTVTWTQGADDAPHTATATDDAETFDSDTLSDEGDDFEFTFEDAGEYPYFCSIHPEMVGLVTVVE